VCKYSVRHGGVEHDRNKSTLNNVHRVTHVGAGVELEGTALSGIVDFANVTVK
jgi:hypothetical protein